MDIIIPTSKKDAQTEKKIHSDKKLFESDINPIFRCLEQNYLGKDLPTLNVAFFDIETDFDPELGFSDAEDPYAIINAISIYCTWLDSLITLAIPPKDIPMHLAEEMCYRFDNCYLFNNEADMLNAFLDIIDDADVLSGWFSEGFDIPYTVNRITRALSKSDGRRLCLWGREPKKREYDRGGKMATTFDLVGRIHLDYMNLYKKYTYHEMHSYSLDAIAEYELNERKIQYEGTLDQLYNNDFEKFVDYNRQDVLILKKLDDMLKFLDLANTLAHENAVLIPSTMGSVAMIDQAITNFAHEQNLVVPDKKHKDDTIDYKVAGAFVATPKRGLHEWIGAIDINSLYPSALRALNMSPETIIGQLRPLMTGKMIKEHLAKGKKYTFAGAWEGHFGSLEYAAVMEKKPGVEITIDWEAGGSDILEASDVYKLIFQNDMPWILSANGTIFTTEREGIVPKVLASWYSARQEMQTNEANAITPEDKAYWDKRQLVKKINLNSLYGAILNKHFRFYDKRIGQSTTLTGRTITKHMMSEVNQLITGKYSHTGDAVTYGDTDSIYFSAYKTLKSDIDAGIIDWNKESILNLYGQIADAVNESFPTEMTRSFNCPPEYGKIIKGGLELIARSGLMVKKKKYALLKFWDDKHGRLDQGNLPGKLKAMGLDLKRSDTPEFMQQFLEEILWDLLTNNPSENIIKKINDFRGKFNERESWEKGTPKKVNNLTKYTAMEEDLGKANLPGHVRAAMNWNNLRRMNSDNYSMAIQDGQKTIVCKLKNHPLNFTSVAYPIDEHQLPSWFKNLPFDDYEMEFTIIDKKIDNLVGVLKWNIPSVSDSKSAFDNFFEFE